MIITGWIMARTAKGLGKGIDALIPSKPTSKKAEVETKEIVKEVIKEVVKEVPAEIMVNLSDIEPNRDQPRKEFKKAELEELAESIKQYGIIQPLVVQKKGKMYEIIAGERRWRAAKLAKQKKVPVVIKDYTPQEVMEIALIENIQRQDLNPIEEAMAYKRLIDEYSLLQDDVAKKVSKSRSTITNALRLLNLPKEVQSMVEKLELSMGHARALLGIEKQEEITPAAQLVVQQKLSVRETEKLVKKINRSGVEKKSKETAISQSEEVAFEKIRERLENITGSKVVINRKAGNKGKIEINYFSTDDLERLIALFESIQQ